MARNNWTRVRQDKQMERYGRESVGGSSSARLSVDDRPPRRDVAHALQTGGAKPPTPPIARQPARAFDNSNIAQLRTYAFARARGRSDGLPKKLKNSVGLDLRAWIRTDERLVNVLRDVGRKCGVSFDELFRRMDSSVRVDRAGAPRVKPSDSARLATFDKEFVYAGPIRLEGDAARRLKALAHERGATVEQVAASLLQVALLGKPSCSFG